MEFHLIVCIYRSISKTLTPLDSIIEENNRKVNSKYSYYTRDSYYNNIIDQKYFLLV